MNIQIAIALLLLAALLLVTLGLRRILGTDSVIDERLHIYATWQERRTRQPTSRIGVYIRQVRNWLNAALPFLFSNQLVVQLASANWPITAVEYTILRVTLTVLAFVLGWAISGYAIGGFGLALLVYIIPGIVLRNRINRRRLDFERQLVDVLVLINGAVRAGFSLVQSLEVVVKEMRAPANEEFGRVLHEISLGRSIGQALENLSVRMRNRDLDLLITAINIQYTVGGNLTVMLEAVTETIRERIRLFHEVRVLTTQQRYTSYILALLPFIVFGILFFLSPEYMMGLFDRRIIFIPIFAVLGIVAGFFIVRRMARVEI
jgi:tight adherence protein B